MAELLRINEPEPERASFWVFGGTDETTWDDIRKWVNAGNHFLDALGYLVFWQHDKSLTVPNAVWTPMPFNVLRVSGGGIGAWAPDFGAFNAAAATTIAAGSNSVALPTATINVASTEGFTTKGYLVIEIGGTDRMVQYTGKTATTFTGASNSFSVGTMLTGQVVRQANVGFNPPSKPGTPRIANVNAEVAWANVADGVKRGIRVRFFDGLFNFAGGTVTGPAMAGAGTASDPFHHMQTVEQPLNMGAGGHNRIEVFQSRSPAATLDSVIGEGTFDAPRLVMFNTAAKGGDWT